MNKAQAEKLLEENVGNINLRRHCYAVSYAMDGIYDYLSKNNLLSSDSPEKSKWEMLGLVHDSDYELTKDDWSKHTLITLDWLKKLGILEDGPLYNAIKSHNANHTGFKGPDSQMEWALECCDELTGFIVAATLVLPTKKISDVKFDSLKKKWKEPAFARAVKREQIEQCEQKLGIPLDTFIEIVLASMRMNSDKLGL